MTPDNYGRLLAAALESIGKAGSLGELDDARVRYLSRRGEIALLFDQIRSHPPEDRPALGKELNRLRDAVQKSYDERKIELEGGTRKDGASPDLTLPGR